MTTKMNVPIQCHTSVHDAHPWIAILGTCHVINEAALSRNMKCFFPPIHKCSQVYTFFDPLLINTCVFNYARLKKIFLGCSYTHKEVHQICGIQAILLIRTVRLSLLGGLEWNDKSLLQ